jgi:hypothetical protein
MRKFVVVALTLAGACAAQETPAGWRVMKDRPNRCQMAVPHDWTSDNLVPSFATSPDGKTTAVVHSQQPGRAYQEVVESAKKLYQGVKVVEETSSHTWFTYKPMNGRPGEGLYIATSGGTVCTATVDYGDPSTASFARKIAATVAPVK